MHDDSVETCGRVTLSNILIASDIENKTWSIHAVVHLFIWINENVDDTHCLVYNSALCQQIFSIY